MSDVLAGAGGEVIQDRDLVPTGHQSVTEVAADKTCSTGDENAHGARLSARRALLGVLVRENYVVGLGEVSSFSQERPRWLGHEGDHVSDLFAGGI